MRTLLSIDKFHDLVQAGDVPDDVLLRKQVNAEVEVSDDDSREVLFTISTAVVDRAGDSIAVEGWELDNYRSNPVVLWAHDQRGLPVGKGRQVYTEGRNLKSLTQFTEEKLYAFGYKVYQFYKAGFLSAVSVGFNPLKYAFVDDKERRGVDFEKQELLEYSAVPVPCHPGALAERSAGDLSVDPLIDWAVDVIRTHRKPELKTVRDIEDFLRDVGGFSRKEAKTFAGPSYEAIQRDVDAAAQPTTEEDHSTELAVLLKSHLNLIQSRRLTWK